MVFAQNYGASAAHLEALCRMVQALCPRVRFAGHSVSLARTGACAFRLPPGRSSHRRSVWVQAPVMPAGKLRAGTGRWRFRFTSPRGRPPQWRSADSIDQVVDWICSQANSR